jgi:S1-C subfamily serine protease
MAVAIPTHSVLDFLSRTEPGEPGFLGVTLQAVEIPHAIAASYEVEDETAVMLTGIEPGSAAEDEGLLHGDVLLGLGKSRRGIRHLEPALRSMRAGRALDLWVLRGGRLVEAHATPVARN